MVTSVAPRDGLESPTPHYAIGDVHGCAAELRASLRRGGLIDGADNWTGGSARLHFLGDLTDRGPDGVGVIELIMRLGELAPDSGGTVDCVLGNHEVMLLAAHRLGGPNPSPEVARFRDRWVANGGQKSDTERLTATHMDWLASLPAVITVDEHVLLHSDTAGYLEFGEDAAAINDAVRAVLDNGHDLDGWDHCTHLLTTRLAFASDEGEAVCHFLRALGGRQLVHGHSPVPLLLRIPPGSVTGPLIYAGGRAVDMDTGTFMGGPCLVNPLPSIPPGTLWPEPTHDDVDDPTQSLPTVVD
jgi:hypothetical protein